MADLVDDRLAVEERAAWDEYLEATRDLDQEKYQEVEAWAWMKLQKQLLTIFKRRPKAA